MKDLKNLEKAWKDKIILDLGTDSYKRLFSKTNEGITISPHYTSNKKSLINPEKLLFPKEWDIVNEIKCNKTTDLNKQIKSLYENEIKNLIISNYADQFIDNSYFFQGNIYFKTDKPVNYNPKFKLLIEPNLNSIEPIDLNKFYQKNFRLNLSSEFFKDSGANIVQEIAFTLSAGIDYVNKFGSSLFNKISFELIQGNNYFFEIAKIQATRILWSIISKKYGNQIDDCIITAKPTSKNKTTKNYNNNIIRTTSECMSGILGGCDFIKSIPYDVKFNEQNEFSHRITNNQLLILKNETLIKFVNNSISGSYYITYLIEKLAEKSLELIKKIEANGGYFHDQKNQEIFQEILMNHKREKEQYESGDKVLVGQNKFINA